MTPNSTPRTIAIYGSRRQEQYLSKIADLLRLLQDNGFQIVIHPNLYKYLLDKIDLPESCLSAMEIPSEAEAALSIGGDGTFLRTAQWVGNRQIPILGINTGHLGFLSMCDIEDPKSIVDDITDRNLTIEQRSMLRLEAPYIPDDFWPYALNEVAILKQDTASMITVQTKVDNSFLTDYLADGLLGNSKIYTKEDPASLSPNGSYGYSGVVVVRAYDNYLYAFDICCTYEADREIALKDDGFFLKCPQCGSSFEIGNGTGYVNSGPATQRLKKYHTTQNSTQKIRIYN